MLGQHGFVREARKGVDPDARVGQDCLRKRESGVGCILPLE